MGSKIQKEKIYSLWSSCHGKIIAQSRRKVIWRLWARQFKSHHACSLKIESSDDFFFKAEDRSIFSTYIYLMTKMLHLTLNAFMNLQNGVFWVPLVTQKLRIFLLQGRLYVYTLIHLYIYVEYVPITFIIFSAGIPNFEKTDPSEIILKVSEIIL